MPLSSAQVQPVSTSEVDSLKRHLLPLPHEISIRRKVVLSPEDVRVGSIAVAGGEAKAAAVGAALRGRLISGLLTDESVARAILEGA